MAEPLPPAALEALVLGFLDTEGLSEVAAAFRAETGLPEAPAAAAGAARVAARRALLAGDVAAAVETASAACPLLLDLPQNSELAFRLQKQSVVELIARGDVESAVAVARRDLAGECADDPARLRELEEVMMLVVDSTSPAATPTAVARAQAARRLNEAMLRFAGEPEEPALLRLLRLLVVTRAELQAMDDCPPLGDTEAAVGWLTPPL